MEVNILLALRCCLFRGMFFVKARTGAPLFGFQAPGQVWPLCTFPLKGSFRLFPSVGFDANGTLKMGFDSKWDLTQM